MIAPFQDDAAEGTEADGEQRQRHPRVVCLPRRKQERANEKRADPAEAPHSGILHPGVLERRNDSWLEPIDCQFATADKRLATLTWQLAAVNRRLDPLNRQLATVNRRLDLRE